MPGSRTVYLGTGLQTIFVLRQFAVYDAKEKLIFFFINALQTFFRCSYRERIVKLKKS